MQAVIRNGTKLLVSVGKVIKKGDVYAISCPSYSGYSGSLILVKEGSLYKIIGIFHRGPASFLHKSISQILNKYQDSTVRTNIESLAATVKKKEQKDIKNKRKPRMFLYLKNNRKLFENSFNSVE